MQLKLELELEVVYDVMSIWSENVPYQVLWVEPNQAQHGREMEMKEQVQIEQRWEHHQGEGWDQQGQSKLDTTRVATAKE